MMLRCEWCGQEHDTTDDIVAVTIVGGVNGIICRKCKEDFDAEAADEAEYQAGLQAARDDEFFRYSRNR